MIRRASGFTVVEVLAVVIIGGILTTLAVKGLGATSSQIAARQARNAFSGMVARTRAQAIESGRRTLLIADARGDSVVIFANGQTVENVRFAEEMGIDIQTSQPITLICMTPRGYADPNCNSFSTVIKMAFVQGAESREIAILPLGQLRW